MFRNKVYLFFEPISLAVACAFTRKMFKCCLNPALDMITRTHQRCDTSTHKERSFHRREIFYSKAPSTKFTHPTNSQHHNQCQRINIYLMTQKNTLDEYSIWLGYFQWKVIKWWRVQLQDLLRSLQLLFKQKIKQIAYFAFLQDEV